MVRLFWEILKDEKGALLDWGLDWMAAKERGAPPEIRDWEGVGDIKKRLSQNILGRIGGGARPYQRNAAFDVPQPGIEGQAEGVISKRLGQLPSAADYKAKVEAAKTQDIKREKDVAAEQKVEESNMYNRLGLVSSTPWMQRAGELGEESLTRQGDISSKYDMYGLNYGLEADKLTNDIINQYISQATGLGKTQRAGQQFGTTMSYNDLIRQLTEEEAAGAAANKYLGMGAVTPGQRYASDTTQWEQPNTYDWLSGGVKEGGGDVMNILRMMGMGG